MPREPLPDWATSIEVLEGVARLVRRPHDASDGWDPPADAVWGSIPGDLPAGFVPMFGEPELAGLRLVCQESCVSDMA